MNRKALHGSIRRHITEKKLKTTQWGRNLIRFAGRLRARIDNNQPLEISRVVFKKKNRSDELRMLSVTENLEDRVLQKLTASYLRERVDPVLDRCVCAFRSRGTGLHSEPVADLINFARKHDGAQLYAAEADIVAFFDTIPHSVVMDSVEIAIEKLRVREENIDHRALAIIKIALDTYSFEDALEKGTSELQASSRGLLIATPPEELLCELRERYGARGFGLPQGGSISPILANLVLTRVDSMVMKVPGSEMGYYRRYCDDILIVHPDENVCQRMLDEYMRGLSCLGLAAHEPSKEPVSPREFFEQKTLLPYRWGSKSIHPENRGWVSFLGYHIRYDGNLRLRKNTVRNEHDKQIQLVDKILTTIDKNLESALRMPSDVHPHFRGTLRMISMAVGRNRLRAQGRAIPQPCWSDAFPLLKPNRSISQQLRRLDRNRERQLQRLKRALERRGIPVTWPKFWRPRSFTHFGAPYSYFSLLRGADRPGIPDFPKRRSRSIRPAFLRKYGS